VKEIGRKRETATVTEIGIGRETATTIGIGITLADIDLVIGKQGTASSADMQ